MHDHKASASITINARHEAIWDALTKPEQVKEYFFGTDLETTWEPGTPIVFRGEWEGKTYEDKGEVISFLPMDSLSYSYWSPLAGSEDKPENYQTLTYTLTDTADAVQVTITQENVESEEKAAHSSENWTKVLQALKEYVEKDSI